MKTFSRVTGAAIIRPLVSIFFVQFRRYLNKIKPLLEDLKTLPKKVLQIFPIEFVRSLVTKNPLLLRGHLLIICSFRAESVFAHANRPIFRHFGSSFTSRTELFLNYVVISKYILHAIVNNDEFV